MARLRKKVSQSPRVLEAAQAAQASKTPAATQRPDYLFYAVPPLILLLLFAFMKINSQPPSATRATAAAPAAVKKPTTPAIAKPTAPAAPVIPPDVNNDLPAFAIPAGQVNHLADGKAMATQSGFAKKFPAEQSLDGSIQNDAKVSIAEAVGGEPAWWQAELSGNGAPVKTVVIYGGGTGNPSGKLLGGFRVELEDVNGETQSRVFHELGFALEGHEAWTLTAPAVLKTIRVSSLNRRSPIILREVLAIGEAQ